MLSKSIWNDQIPERDGVKTPINAIAISPGTLFVLNHGSLSTHFFTDGSRIIAAAGNRVLLYKSDNGDLIESLRGFFKTSYNIIVICLINNVNYRTQGSCL